MELQGKVVAALPQRSGESARGKWMSQEFVIQYQDGQYSRNLVFTLFGEERINRCNVQVGQFVNVAFDIDAHEWNGRWFTDIRAFDVRLVDPNATQQPPVNVAPPQDPFASKEDTNPAAPFPPQPEGDNPDNLPF